MSRYWKRTAWLLLLLPFLFGSRALAGQPRQEPTPAPTPDPRFGAIESFWAPAEAAELGVGWERILFYWNEIQPQGPDDWNTLHVLEEWLVEANSHNRNVLGLLKNTAAWATDGEPYSGVPRGLYLPVDDPDNLWAAYVGKVIDYYAARGVHHWIVWNEPEIEADVYGHEFDGSVEDYYQLLKVTYQVAKARDPQAVIHMAGWSYWHDPDYLNKFLDVVTADPTAAANNFYFDTLSLHIYFRVETVETLVKEVDAIQNSYGIDKPIWINETNSSPNLDPGWPVERPQFQVDLDQQAWFLTQAYALGFGAGAESIGVYKLIDVRLPEGGESFGLVRPNFEKRPAFFAYRTLIDQLSGFETAVTQRNAQYTSVLFSRPDGLVRMVWSRQDRALTVVLPAFAESAVLVSLYGEETLLTAEDGVYTIDLAGARCRGECHEGGPPVYIVEQGVARPDVLPTLAPAVAALTLTPTPAVTHTFTPMPTATATATATPTLTPTPTPSPTATATLTPSPTPPATATPLPDPTAAEPVPDAAGEDAAEAASGSLGWVFLGLAGLVTAVVAWYVVRR